jgi:ADP-heptose:LPS heptosyltransferase
VLVIRLGALGDVLHTTPAVRVLAEAGIAVDYLTEPYVAPLVEGQRDIRAVIRYDRRGADRGLRALWQLARRLRAERYDAVVDFQGSLRTRLLSVATGARRLPYWKDRPGTPRHAVDNFAATLAPLGLSLAGNDVSGSTARARVPRFVPGSAAAAAVDAALRAAGVPAAAALVALHPGASHPVNRWLLERFGVLAARLAARPGVAVVLTGAPSDRLLVDTALGAARPAFPVDLSGHLDLPSLGALFARCAVVVAPDTGPLHLATAVGAKTVAIFGPSDPLRTGPVGEGHRVVRVDLDCVPCRARHCHRLDRPHACMEDLTVEAVEAAVLVALEPSAAVAR